MFTTRNLSKPPGSEFLLRLHHAGMIDEIIDHMTELSSSPVFSLETKGESSNPLITWMVCLRTNPAPVLELTRILAMTHVISRNSGRVGRG